MLTSDNRERVLAAAILLGLLHLCFFSCIWGNKTFLESARDQPSIMPQGAWAGKPVRIAFPKMLDTGAPAWVPEPLLKLIGNDYATERTLPLWNPYQAYGTPLAANMQSQPFYPLTLALSLHPTPRTYNWFILARLFLAGLFAYLFIRFFVSFVPALASAVTSMLAGYYVLFITMPHLSVEVLLPAALWAAERLLRRPRYSTVVWFSAILFLVMVGGMPESSLLLLSFIYLYVLFRLAADRRLHFKCLRRATYLLIATVTGLALSGLLLFPFHEYMTLGFDMHQPSNISGGIQGLTHDPRNLSIFTYLFPLLYGPPFSSALSPGWNGLRNYIGLIGLFLSLTGILGSSWRRNQRDRLLSSLACFFGLCVVAIVLKRYGFAPVNFVGDLPLFSLVQFVKYDEVILSICVSMLCAIGLERMSRRRVPFGAQMTALTVTFLTVPLAVIFSRKLLVKELLIDHIALGFPLWTLGLPICLLFCAAILLINYNRKLSENPRHKILAPGFAIGMLALLTGESVVSYIVPAYYSFHNRLPTIAENPYVGAPFISHLQAQPGRYRIFAADGILFPNWASAFGLFDIRDLDAMYYSRYFPFLRAFSPPKIRGYGDELEDRFTGQGNLEFSDLLPKRLLQLSSVKYFVTMRPVTEPNAIVEEILKQTQGRIVNGKENLITRQNFVLDGAAREALGEHPPYDRLPYSVLVGEKKQSFHFSYALNPAVFEHTCGDGVEFVVEAKSASGRITKLFSSYIDPKRNITERHWINGSADLDPYRGQRIELLFSTNGGPKGNTCNDWAAWSNFEFGSSRNDNEAAPELVYDREVKIYRFADVLPRAAIYYKAAIRTNENEVLRELTNQNLSIFHLVVLDGSKLTARDRKFIQDMSSAQPDRAKPAEITSYKSRTVTIEATLERSGILVLNDTNYPGWEVEVDGHKDRILNANYLFRGVALAAGKHVVRFIYNPRSFRLGFGVSLIAFTVLTLWGILAWSARRREKRPGRRSELAPHLALWGVRDHQKDN
jgi:membrane protein YfhO